MTTKYICSKINDSTIPEYFKSKYDFEITDKDTCEKDLCNFIKNNNDNIIKISEDNNVSSKLLINSLYEQNDDLHIVILSSFVPDSIINCNINKDNIYFIGSDMNDYEEEKVKLLDVNYYKSNKFISKPQILDSINNNNVYLMFDVSLVNTGLENDKSNINLETLEKIINNFININIKCIDFFNFISVEDKINKKKSQICKLISKNLFKIKESKINIMNENSRFLIYRPVEIENDEIGWFILRGINNDMREKILSYIEDDKIIEQEIEINKEYITVYLTSTCINEQNEKSYFTATSILDCVLYPQEKTYMMFELLNN